MASYQRGIVDAMSIDGSSITDAESLINQNVRRPKEDVLNWNEFFMGVAFLSAMRSKDPVTRVGACIVNADNRIVGTGYNGMPNKCKDSEFSWKKDTEEPLENKSTYVCHAELNAVLNTSNNDIKNSTIYVGLFPCNECAKIIIQSGIKNVIYYSDKHREKKTNEAAKTMFDAAKVEYKEYNKKLRKNINIDFSEIVGDVGER